MEPQTINNPYGLRLDPYPYQQEGIEAGLRMHRLLIGDEPGLGKTLQSIGIVNAAHAYPALVICPSSLKINWQREFAKFAGVDALILDNTVLQSWPYMLADGTAKVAIVNYESLRKFFVRSPARGPLGRLKDVVFYPFIKMFRSLIIDESHRVKDPTAQQTIITRGIADGIPFRILLSGTPVVNRPADLIAQLSIMGRLSEFGGRTKFLADYGGGETTKGPARGGEPDPPRNLEQLSAELYARCMIRREKSKVLTQLPEKTRVDLVVPISNREAYLTAERDLETYLRVYTASTDRDIRRKMRMEALVKFMTLRSLVSVGKVKAAIEFISTFLDTGEPLILFCSLHEIVDALLKAFPSAVTVTGRDSMQAKQAAIDAFQGGRSNLIICSIKAAGVGLTLTRASSVAFLELPWTYADCCQCEDRAHRIGQLNNVTCYYLLGNRTIDNTLYQIIHRKKSVAAEITGTDDSIPQDKYYIEELITNFLPK